MSKTYIQSLDELNDAWRSFVLTLSDEVGVPRLLRIIEKSKAARVLLVILLVVFAVLYLWRPLHAGNETRYYSPKGDYVGRSSVNTANPSQRSIYDSHGKYMGRAMTKPDGSVKYYDPHGNFQGSSLPNKRPYQKK